MTAVNIRITDRIEGNTLENSTFKDYTVTHGGKEYKHNAKDDQSSMTETMVEIQIEENANSKDHSTNKTNDVIEVAFIDKKDEIEITDEIKNARKKRRRSSASIE